MLLRLFLLFTLIPIAELALLVRIGGAIGLWPTLALVAATGAAGAWLARREGLKSWRALQGEMAAGKLPGEEMVHGMLILIAGIVLLTPGVITDAAGLALLVRPVRRGLISRFRSRVESQIRSDSTGFVGGPGMGIFWSGMSGPPPGGGAGFESRPADRDLEDGAAAGGRRAGYPGGREILVDDEEPSR